jgi:hypothetical protein
MTRQGIAARNATIPRGGHDARTSAHDTVAVHVLRVTSQTRSISRAGLASRCAVWPVGGLAPPAARPRATRPDGPRQDLDTWERAEERARRPAAARHVDTYPALAVRACRARGATDGRGACAAALDSFRVGANAIRAAPGDDLVCATLGRDAWRAHLTTWRRTQTGRFVAHQVWAAGQTAASARRGGARHALARTGHLDTRARLGVALSREPGGHTAQRDRHRAFQHSTT